MPERPPDVIMADFLLNGGKMLATSCQVCGAPLFDYKGTIKCVVCEEKKTTSTTCGEPSPVRGSLQQGGENRPATGLVSERIREELANTVLTLCHRVREESEPERCRILVECLSKSVEALHHYTHS